MSSRQRQQQPGNTLQETTSPGYASHRIYANVRLNGSTPIRFMVDSVASDTKLYWKSNDRLRYGTIEDLFLEYTNSFERDSFKVQTITGRSMNDSSIGFEDLLDVVYHGIKDVYKVTLRNGKTVKITEDHSLMCANGYHTKIIPQSFNESPRVISVDNYNMVNGESEFAPYDDKTLTFMGLWMADGSYRHLSRKSDRELSGVQISTDKGIETFNWLQEFVTGLTDTRIHIPLVCSPNGEVSIYRKSLAESVYSVFGNVDSYTKRVPEFLFIATNAQIASFLRGYFSGDGSIYELHDKKYGSFYEASCVSVNRALLEDVSTLLDRLGIKHNIQNPYKQSKTGYKSHQLYYKLTIRDEPSVQKFVEMIGFIKRFRFKKREIYRRNKRLRPVSLRQIRSIEYIGPQHIYDISVAKTEAFVANGIYLHNTGADVSIVSTASANSIKLNTKNSTGTLNLVGVTGGSGAPLVNVSMAIETQPAFSTSVAVTNSNFNLLCMRDLSRVYDVNIRGGKASLIPRSPAAVNAINTIPDPLLATAPAPVLDLSPEQMKIGVIVITILLVLGVLS